MNEITQKKMINDSDGADADHHHHPKQQSSTIIKTEKNGSVMEMMTTEEPRLGRE